MAQEEATRHRQGEDHLLEGQQRLEMTQPEEDETSCCCSCCCGKSCKESFGIFMKYGVGRSMQLFFYVLDIATDIAVAVADFKNGDPIFAYTTLGLVFAPGFLFAVFTFANTLTTHTGILGCCKAFLWLLGFPLLPLWPIGRDLHQIFHGIMALCPKNRSHHLELLNRPSRAYLVKFLEAFTEAAPQILLRLYKITLRRQELPFFHFEPLEMVQVSFSLLSLSTKLISTYQKHITTNHIINGEMDNHHRFKLPCCIQIIVFFWWGAFLVARFEVMALFAAALGWWLYVVIGVHVLLVFAFQTVASGKNKVKRIFIYLFSAFVFIFAYLEFNMKARLKVSAWFPYVIYTILVFLENSVMLVAWYFVQENVTAGLPDQDVYTRYREGLIFIHYGAFGVAILMMCLTFCLVPKGSQQQEAPRDESKMGVTTENEHSHLRQTR